MAWAMRRSAKRICYQTVWSSAMNGISSNTRVVSLTPWWQKGSVHSGYRAESAVCCLADLDAVRVDPGGKENS